MPVVSRDRIKEGYVHTVGGRHDEMPADVNAIASQVFFDIVEAHLARRVSIIIEAAFQHRVWADQLPKIQSRASLLVIECVVDPQTAAERHLQRGLQNPERERFHGDERVRHYRQTGHRLPPDPFESPDLNVPTRIFRTDDNGEGFPQLVEWIRSHLA